MYSSYLTSHFTVVLQFVSFHYPIRLVIKVLYLLITGIAGSTGLTTHPNWLVVARSTCQSGYNTITGKGVAPCGREPEQCRRVMGELLQVSNGVFIMLI